MLKFFGTLGKGWATLSGLVVTAVGIVTGASQGSEAGEAVNTILTGVPAIVTAIGALLTVFGIGRKSGVAAADSIKESLK